MKRHAKAPSVGPTASSGGRAGDSTTHPRTRSALILAALCAAFAFALIPATPAFAALQYSSPVPFNAGQPGFEIPPAGIAVDTSTNPSDPSAGDIYVVTSTRAHQYTAAAAAAGSDSPEHTLPPGGTSGEQYFARAWGVAVDPANGNVYVTDLASPDKVYKFDPEGNPLPFTLDPLLAGVLPTPAGIAVNPNNGNVLVGSLSSSTIAEFDSSGAFAGNAYFGPTVSQGIAVNSSGEVYVATGDTGAVKFAAPGSSYTTLTASKAGGIAINPSNQHVFVSGGASAAEFDTAGNQVGTSFGGTELTDSRGIAVSADGQHVYVNDAGGPALDYTKRFLAIASTEAAGDVAGVTATLHGSVDPDGGPSASCSFAYGTDPDLKGAKTVPCAPAGSYSSPTAVTADLSGLNPVTTYYFRLGVSNGEGTALGETLSFQTTTSTPLPVTDAVTELTATTATLRGTLNPGGLPATYHFDYGLTTSYGSRAPAGGDSVLGVGNQPRLVSGGATGLQPNSTYHYRLVATNSLGTTTGEDRTFTTDPADNCSNSAVRIQQGSQRLAECRAYERVSPAENAGIPTAPGNRLGFRASSDGNQVLYSPNVGAYPGAESGPLRPKVVATRTSGDWIAKALDKPTSSAIAKADVARAIWAVSKDMSRMVVVSSLSLGGQGVDGNGNVYIYDANTDTYTLVMTSSDPQFFESIAGTRGELDWIGASSNLGTIAFEFGDPKQVYVWSESSGLRSLGVGRGIIAGAYTDQRPGSVSNDGSRIYYRDETGAVALDENGEKTVVSVSRRVGDSPDPVMAFPEAASPDGRYLIFSARDPLTEDAPLGPPGFGSPYGLYRYDAVSDSIEYLAHVSGDVAADEGILKAWPERREAYVRSGDDLYHLDNGEFTLVVPGAFPFGGALATPGSSASPDGRYFSFESSRKLTSYDNHGVSEVYLYDAEAEVLSCASCRSDGVAPSGPAGVSEPVFETYLPQAVSNDGTVFFDTPDPLIATDVNGTRDVYGYRAGRVSLISPGTQPFAAVFAEVTPSGRDVFFTTAQRLVATDTDAATDLYDARVEGGIASQNVTPIPPCSGDACRGATPAAPEALNAATETLRGRENPHAGASKRCGKGQQRLKRKGKSRCVKQHKRGAKQSKQNRNRSQGR